MRFLPSAFAAWLCLTTLASAQAPLTAEDRQPLRAEPGVLVHPTLGFRFRDVGLAPGGIWRPEIARAVSPHAAPETMHTWSYAQGDDSVRVVLVSSDAADEAARTTTARTERAFVELGATPISRVHEDEVSEATVRSGARTVVVRSAPLHTVGRSFVVVIAVALTDAALADAALATTVARSLEIPRPPSGSLSRAAIRATIRARIDDVRRCYETSLRERGDLTGRVTIRFVIQADGTVQTASAIASTLGHEPTERCVAAVVRRLRFPRPDGGGVVGVNYPFVLSTEPPPAGGQAAQ